MRLYIDSSTRSSIYPSSSQFRFNINGGVNRGLGILLRKYVIWDSSFIVNQYNNTFTINDGVVTYTITLSQGNYNPVQLASLLQSSLNNTGAPYSWTVTYNSATNGFTITCTTSCTYYFTSYPLAGKLLGFTANASGTSVSSNVPALLGTTGFYYLCFTNVPSANIQGNRYSFVIPNNVALGSLLTSNNELVSDLLDFNSELSFQYLDIELRDCNYNLVVLNSDWQLELDIVTK